QVAKERDIQVASLGSLASEVSALYGLKSNPAMVTASTEQIQEVQVHSSLDQLYALKHTALSGAASVGISATIGSTVIAPADGVVTFADFLGGYGRAIMVDHGHGISTRYGHLSSLAV